MRLTLRQLQIFAGIADCGSTAAAARMVSLTQSAASAALNELEGLLDARLFDRVGRGLVLNDNGRALLPKARWLLEGADEAERQFTRPPGRTGAGPLRIGASTTIGNYLMPRILAAYQNQADISQVSIRIDNTSEIVAAVGSFKIDVGFIEGPTHDSQLGSRQWLKDELVIFAAPTHELAGGADRRISVAELRGANWLLREAGSGTREAVESALLPRLHHIQSGISFGDSEAIKRAAAAGLGVSCLSRWVVEDMLRYGTLQELHTVLPKLTRMFYTVVHPDKYISANLQAFMAFSERANAW